MLNGNRVSVELPNMFPMGADVMETDWTLPQNRISKPDHQQYPKSQQLCYYPHSHQMVQVCDLSLTPQSMPPPPPPPAQPHMTLVQSSWWPVFDLTNDAGPWSWIPCMETVVEPEIEPEVVHT